MASISRESVSGRSVAIRTAGLVGLALAVANCAGPDLANRRSGNKYGVAASPKVIADGEPVPKGGGRDMIGKPYVVGGRTYVPTSGQGFSREGWASWYGTAFHGRLTANGEIFDRGSIAAASPTLPLPSYVRVTNLLNKRSMIVRVNDRGPYEQGRLIDVSERVAEALDFRHKGTARVRVEYVGKASTKGSDDEKLLASLRTDGSSAPFGRARGPVMLADLSDEPAPRPRPVVEKTVVAEAALEVAPRLPTESTAEAPIGTVVAEASAPAALSPLLPTDLASAESSSPGQDEVAEAEDAPLPPRRPTELGGSRVGQPPARMQTRPVATVELLPPQRPAISGIY